MRQKCGHDHTEHCNQCETLEGLLEALQRVTCEVHYGSNKDKDEAFYLLQHANLTINLWKRHQIWTIRQDHVRVNVLDRLDEKKCLITNNWVMKFLPQ